MKVTWPQLRRLLKVDETFAETGGEYESYTVMDLYTVRMLHTVYDDQWYTVDNHIQLVNDEECDYVYCIIQMEGQPEVPMSFKIADGEVNIEIYSKCVPPMMLAP